jgi:hypothetical protein
MILKSIGENSCVFELKVPLVWTKKIITLASKEKRQCFRRKSTKIAKKLINVFGENRRKSAKIGENWRKSAKIGENQRKSAKIGENRRKSAKIGENREK